MLFIKNKNKILVTKSSSRKFKGGFTLVEMIVAIAIFTIVAFVAVGALLKVVDANKKSQSMKTSINNLNFALESISREMRVGSNYYCSQSLLTTSSIPGAQACSLTGSYWTIAFYSSKICTDDSSKNIIYAYHFDGSNGGTIKKAEQSDICAIPISSSGYAPIVADDIKFTQGTVKVVTGSDIQSYAQFHFAGYSGVKEKNKTYFDLQTTVSQRLAD
ncbi:MAG TPA: type II secretion system protein [Candidatus Paceibacterota bacterium]